MVKNISIYLYILINATIALSCSHSEDLKVSNGKISAEKILSIKIGNKMDSITGLFGKPIEEVKTGGSNQNICPTPFDTLYKYYITYKSKSIDNRSLMIWIHFSSTKKVNEVYIKMYDGWDEKEIYDLSSSPCAYVPSLPYTTEELNNIMETLKVYFN